MDMDFLSLLDWQPSVLPRQIGRKFASILANDLGASARENGSIFRRDGEAADILKRVRDLPDAALLRILRAPEVHHRLLEARSQPDPDLLPVITSWIDAERARLDPAYPLDAPVWSATKDVYFPRGAARLGGPDAFVRDPEAWAEDEPFRAPLLGGRIPLDFVSPASSRPLQASAYRPTQFGSTSPLGTEARLATMAKLDAAESGLGRVSPAAHAFVHEIVRVIVPRTHDPGRPAYASSSSRSFIGLVTFVNPQLQKAHAEALTSSLVHEAIHSFLYMCEFQAPFVIDQELVRDALLVSPWTGGRLSIHTYIHACFVWYGLARLWRSPSASEVYPAEAVLEQRRHADAGFSHGVIGPLLPFRKHVSRFIMEQIEQMESAHER